MRRLTWTEVEAAAGQLADQIAARGFNPDCLVGVTTGGLFPLALLAKRMEGKAIYTVTTKRHWDDERDWIDITYLPEVDLKGKSVLLIDEITHVGTTLASLVEVFRDRYQVGTIMTATLAANHDVATSWPDFHVLVEQGDWILFPWENEAEFEPYDVHMLLEGGAAAPSATQPSSPGLTRQSA